MTHCFKNGMNFAAALFLLASVTSIPADPAAVPPPSVVSVDYARSITGMHSMVGFLHGSTATTPADDKLLPLHPALWRLGYLWMNNRDRVAKLHIPTILILSDSWGARVPKDMTEWEGFVQAMIQNAGGLPYTWDVMNEPDLSYSFQGTSEQYSEMFVHASAILHRHLGPAAQVSGPSISHYDPQYITNFLDYCKAHNAQVDVLSWHELSEDDDEYAVTEHLRDARKRFLENPEYKALRIKKIEINEIVGPSAQYQAGETLAYFDALEQGGAYGACKGCWDDNCGNNTLDGLVTPDTQEPRAVWWATKSYAGTISGRVASRSSDPRVVSFAASGGGNPPGNRNWATVLVGCFHDRHFPADPVTVTLRLTGMSTLPFVGPGRRVHVKVELIPDTGKQAVPQLAVSEEKDVAVVKGAATVLLPPLAAHEADLITLSAPGQSYEKSTPSRP